MKIYYDESEKYKKFLNIIIPTNEEIFDILKKYIPNTISIYLVIKFLQVFHIYHDDITAELYTKINNYVINNIANFKSNFNQDYKLYNRVIKSTPPAVNRWFEILSSHQEL